MYVSVCGALKLDCLVLSPEKEKKKNSHTVPFDMLSNGTSWLEHDGIISLILIIGF